MCLITFAWQTHPHYPFIIVANRDEFYDRPTKEAHFWQDVPSLLAGQDLLQGGSWLGVTKEKRLAAITNVRNAHAPIRGEISRGDIVRDFLQSDLACEDFINQLRGHKDLYGGFNVLLFDGKTLQHYNNIEDSKQIITPGVHSLSNETLDSPWPKAQLATEELQQVILQTTLDTQQLITLLTSEHIASDKLLPNTGVGIELERILSAQFVKMSNYGTRCSTVVLFQQDGTIQFLERTYDEGKFLYDLEFTI